MFKTIFSFIILIYIQIYISSPVCEENKNFCTKCNPVTKLCERCENDVLIPDNNGGCVGKKKCKVNTNYCEKCSLDEQLCQECRENFYSDENGGCSYINNCEISYLGKCLKCSEDFLLFGTSIQICKSLNSEDFLNCDKINIETGLCETCKEGFYLNSGDKKCISTNNCQESINGVCTKCSMSYYLDKSANKCLMKDSNWLYCQQTIDGKTCDICENNGYFDDEGNCIGVNYCSKGAQFSKCELCKEGYYLAKYGNCCSKEPNCNYGDKDIGICTLCNDFYYIDFKDGKCKPNNNDDDFKYCRKADGECYECVGGTYLGEDKKCSSSKYCVESYLGICKYCIEGYHVGKDNICNNIDKCIYSYYFNSCDECEKGYYFNTSSQICEEEIQGLKNCKKTYPTGTYCQQCRNDFYINRTNNLCYSNLENNEFYKCALTLRGEQCDACVLDYYLGSIDKKCSKIPGCEMSENADKCLQCDSEQYCLDVKNGNCQINEYIEEEKDKYFYKCNYTNAEGTKCEVCINDYSVNDKGLCVYNSYCEEPDKDNNCKKCIKDDEAQNTYYCLNSDFGCVVTNTIGCELCNNVTDFDICDKCRDGYILQDGVCVEKK